MYIQYKGWGVWVMVIGVGWLVAGSVAIVMSDIYIPDPHAVWALIDRLGALWCAISAVNIYVLDRYREAALHGKASETAGPIVEIKRDDEFMFIPMRYWPYIFAGFALSALAASYFT